MLLVVFFKPNTYQSINLKSDKYCLKLSSKSNSIYYNIIRREQTYFLNTKEPV